MQEYGGVFNHVMGALNGRRYCTALPPTRPPTHPPTTHPPTAPLHPASSPLAALLPRTAAGRGASWPAGRPEPCALHAAVALAAGQVAAAGAAQAPSAGSGALLELVHRGCRVGCTRDRLLLLRAAGDVTHAAVRAGQLFGEGVDRWEPVPPRLPASQPACAMRCCGNWLMHVQRG